MKHSYSLRKKLTIVLIMTSISWGILGFVLGVTAAQQFSHIETGKDSSGDRFVKVTTFGRTEIYK